MNERSHWAPDLSMWAASTALSFFGVVGAGCWNRHPQLANGISGRVPVGYLWSLVGGSVVMWKSNMGSRKVIPNSTESISWGTTKVLALSQATFVAWTSFSATSCWCNCARITLVTTMAIPPCFMTCTVPPNYDSEKKREWQAATSECGPPMNEFDIYIVCVYIYDVHIHIIPYILAACYKLRS